MSPILSSQGMALATAMAVSGTIILLAFCRQKTLSLTQFAVDRNSDSPPQILRSCISSDEKKREKKKKKKKRVHFAADVVDPIGTENFREERRFNQVCQSESRQRGSRIEMPANRMALYNGILRDRVQRMACSY